MMEDLSLHILDIVENAITAGASRIGVSVNENEGRNRLTIRVSDDGPGMPAEVRRRVLDPFFTTKGKKTGLGLSLLGQAAQQCGGDLTIVSARGRGTTITAWFECRHIDRPPLTNMRGTISGLVLAHPEIDFVYSHRRNGRGFRFDSRRFRQGVGPGLDPGLIGAVRQELEAGLRRIGRT
jgi:hypothetical protein